MQAWIPPSLHPVCDRLPLIAATMKKTCHVTCPLDLRLLLWLLLGVPAASAASVSLSIQRSEKAGQERFDVTPDEPPSNLKPSVALGTEFTFVAPGTFDKPLALMDGAGGQHGRALSECVRALLQTHVTVPESMIPLRGPAELRPTLTVVHRLSLAQWVSTTRHSNASQPTSTPAEVPPRLESRAPLKCPCADYCASTLVCAACAPQPLLEPTLPHFNAPPLKWARTLPYPLLK